MTVVTKGVEKCDTSKIKIGSVWTEHDIGEVVNIIGNKAYVKSAVGKEYEISISLVERLFSFADQYDEEVKVSRTDLIKIVKAAPQTAMTVTFCKKPDAKIIAKELSAGQSGMGDTIWASKVKKLIAGEQRTMVGQHFGVFDEHERLKFQEYGKGPRLVDTRTLSMVIVNRVKYVAK